MPLNDWINVKEALTPAAQMIAAAFAGWLISYNKRRKERAGRIKAEERQLAAEAAQQRAAAELTEIKRRAYSPMLALGTMSFSSPVDLVVGSGRKMKLYWGSDACLHPGVERIPSSFSKGDLVLLYVAIDGKEPRSLRVEVEGDPTSQITQGYYRFLTYQYDPAKRGQWQRVLFAFERHDGTLDKHLYEIAHGERRLRRIEPAGI